MFDLGDLVKFNTTSTIYEEIVAKNNIGIITERKLLAGYSSNEFIEYKFWGYDVLVNGSVKLNVPEECLREY
jgi:hypothetical protein